MGCWGPGLYDNDIAQDILLAFQRLQSECNSPDEISKRIEDEFFEELDDPEDGPIANVVLADQLMHLGIKKPHITQKAVTWIDSGGDLALWQIESPQYVISREQELRRVRELLTEKLPITDRSQTKKRRKQWQWKLGQVYALPLQSNYADSLGLHGEYLIFYVLEPYAAVDGYDNPRVWVKLTRNGILPRNVEEFNQLEFLQVAYTPYSERYRPFESEKDLPHSFKQSYQRDSWGFLCEYAIAMIQAQGSHPPANLVYIGTYNNITPPVGEYRRYRSGLCCAWKFAEEVLLKDYWLYNSHNAEIYRRN